MAIEVMIKRTIKPGSQSKQVVPLILQLRAQATYQPGYISGETLCNLEHPQECIVISRWKKVEDWRRWLSSSDRTETEQKIEELTGEKTEYSIFAPMVAPREP